MGRRSHIFLIRKFKLHRPTLHRLRSPFQLIQLLVDVMQVEAAKVVPCDFLQVLKRLALNYFVCELFTPTKLDLSAFIGLTPSETAGVRN
jgi:hypothetical protein